MCGFVALVNANLNDDKCNSIFYSLSKINNHRGPDSIKYIKQKNNFLLFRRLKIIDLTNSSDQPFFSEDKKIQLLFNGEIYNYIELRNELKSYGVQFKTESDTEVILKSYLFFGLKFINKMRGMFSVVIFDNIKNSVFLFRDHLGQKPLFYSIIKNNLLISSEIKDILYIKKNFGIENKKNSKSVFKYLIRGWADDNDNTFYENIYSLPAACMAIYRNNNFTIKKYWSLKINENKNFEKEEFNQKLNENIKIHLRADVPLAFTLSGGLDSSTILRKSIELGVKNYKAFSIKFKNNLKDESKYINSFIKENKLKHEYIRVEKKYNNNLIEDFMKFQDEPAGSFSFVNQFLLRKSMKNAGFKVVLVGEGGDEVMGGYSRMFIPYLYSEFLSKGKYIPNDFIKKIELVTGLKINQIKKKISIFKKKKEYLNDLEDLRIFKFTDLRMQDIPKDMLYYNKISPSDTNCFKKFLCNHLFKRDLPHILRQEDRISMSSSIENRSPFVDHEFIEYVFSHNQTFFMHKGLNKYMLRETMKDKLPKSFFLKPKIGRPGDASHLIFKFYSNKFIDYIESNKIPYLNSKKILKNFIKDKKNNNITNTDLYFRFLSFFIWQASPLH
jgi:asparagine synthase (glutamine-hydrolysing)